jgi:putative ABC transport system substrate-binding protein
VTGVTNIFPETASKLLDHLKEAMSRLERVAVLWNPDNPGKVLDFKELDTAARGMRVQVTSHEVRSPGDFKAAFDSIERDRPDALITLVETTTFLRRQEVIAFAQKHRLPSAFNFIGHVELGGLMSYSPHMPLLYNRTGALAAKVLRGERPADLPVERPTRYVFSVNLKTARALGLTIPPSLLLRADQVIE